MSSIDFCKKYWKLLCIDGIGIIITILLSVYMQHVISLQYSQLQADRWQASDEIVYHQVSAFIQEDCKLQLANIKEIRSQIQNKMIEASYSAESVSGRLWIDAFMAETNDSISKLSELGSKGVDTVNIMGVGGDFFYFHQPELLSGSYFGDKDIVQDRVLIDQETAWTLFGATDIAGKTVEIAGRTFVVSGVYKASETKYDKLARGNAKYIFMDYDIFQELYPEEYIISYEAILPNPVTGFALISMKQAMGEVDENLYADDVMLSFSEKEYIDNTNRFEVTHLLRKLLHMQKMLMRTTQISYPYWENSVRALEWKLELIVLVQLICLLLPVLTITILIVLGIKQVNGYIKENRKLWMENIADRIASIMRRRDERKALRLEKKNDLVEEKEMIETDIKEEANNEL